MQWLAWILCPELPRCCHPTYPACLLQGADLSAIYVLTTRMMSHPLRCVVYYKRRVKALGNLSDRVLSLSFKFGESRNSHSSSRKRSSSSRNRDRNTNRYSHYRPRAAGSSPSTYRTRAVHASRTEIRSVLWHDSGLK